MGYAVAVDLLLSTQPYRVASVHFPVTRHVSPHYYLEHFTDWLHNCVESYLLDSHNKDPAINKNGLFLRDFCAQLSLKDPYKSLYPVKKKLPTNVIINNRPILQRLDKFYTSAQFIDKAQKSYILPCVLSDHDYAIMDFITPVVPTERRGPGYWKRNVSILDDPITVDAI